MFTRELLLIFFVYFYLLKLLNIYSPTKRHSYFSEEWANVLAFTGTRVSVTYDCFPNLHDIPLSNEF